MTIPQTIGAIFHVAAAILVAIGVVQGLRHIPDGRPFDFGAPWLLAGLFIGSIGHGLMTPR